MASIRTTTRLLSRINQKPIISIIRTPIQQQIRLKTTTETGGIVGNPGRVPFGLIKVVIVTTPCLIIGAKISEKGAALLEDLDIFVPEDDDD